MLNNFINIMEDPHFIDIAKIMLAMMNNWKSVETYQLQL